jgi:integrase
MTENLATYGNIAPAGEVIPFPGGTNNGNNPQPGSTIRVDPIKKLKDIRLTKKLLSDQPRNLCLFTLGINTNLRISDILHIRVSQIRGIAPGEDLVITEKKTGKKRRITLNGAVTTAVGNWLSLSRLSDSDWLFTNDRGKKMTPSWVNRLIKKWTFDINLKGNYGTHSLRKTWGYHQRVTFGVDIPTLMVCFNHGSQKQTLDYLCIQPEEIRSVYKNEL